MLDKNDYDITIRRLSSKWNYFWGFGKNGIGDTLVSSNRIPNDEVFEEFISIYKSNSLAFSLKNDDIYGIV